MATYNGEKYIKEQIDSILKQLGSDDELIISDDGSKDETINIIISINDQRIHVYQNQNKLGPIKNFENALKHAKGDYIFLSDQDDIWMPNKVEKCIEVLKQQEINCVVTNKIIIDKNGIPDGFSNIKYDFTKFSFLRVLTKNPYMGCCMAFNRQLLSICIPFPDKIPMHDIWIGLIAHLKKSVKFIEDPLIAYRRHSNNVTADKSPYSIFTKCKFRIYTMYYLIKRLNNRKNDEEI